MLLAPGASFCSRDLFLSRGPGLGRGTGLRATGARRCMWLCCSGPLSLSLRSALGRCPQTSLFSVSVKFVPSVNACTCYLTSTLFLANGGSWTVVIRWSQRVICLCACHLPRTRSLVRGRLALHTKERRSLDDMLVSATVLSGEPVRGSIRLMRFGRRTFQ